MDEEFALVRDFALIMATAGVALVVFRRLGQPPILGYLVAGLLIGPFTFSFSPVQNVEPVRLLAELGLVLLLFGLGLEFGWSRIRAIGPRVLVIVTLEMSVMLALGYELGSWFGWTPVESLFLGSAMTITSSAILVKVLRDSGQLNEAHGRLIIGISVTEDFAAVLLLTLLSGVATTGEVGGRDIAILAGKLGAFLLTALGLGGILAPRVVAYAKRFGSSEALLVVSLALCFGLALIARDLHLSAAAGAFLMGAVLGDTEFADEIRELLHPIRDMFGAIFFVSIGMLVDIRQAADFIIPGLVVSVVFMIGKVVTNTIASFMVGQTGRTSIRVGMGMPQAGELSLAMAKVGVDAAVVGPLLFPVVAATTAITAFAYPYVFAATNPLIRLVEARTPQWLREYFVVQSAWFGALGRAFSASGEGMRRAHRSAIALAVNLAIVISLVTAGTIMLEFGDELATRLRLGNVTLATFVGVAVFSLSVPPCFFMWRALRGLTAELSRYVMTRRQIPSPLRGHKELTSLFRDSTASLIAALLLVLSIPFLSRLLFVAPFSAPLPIALLIIGVGLTVRTAFRVHRVLSAGFSQTLTGHVDQGR